MAPDPETTTLPFAGTTARGLAADLEAAIARGDVLPGAPLPSVREMAETLDLSPSTISAAMTDLRRRGVIVSEARRGMRVATAPPLARSIGMDTAAASVDRGLLDARHGGPDRTLLPDLRPALGQAVQELEEPRLYGLPGLDPDLGRLAAGRFAADGVPAEHLTVCSGALDGVQRALETSLRPGDAVAVEDPGYADVHDLARAVGLRLVPLAVDDEGPTVAGLRAALAAGVRAVVVTPVGQNPVGAALTAGRAAELRALLADHDELLVIEDQHLSGLGLSAATLAGATGRWLVVRSMAKAYGPDLRVALVAGDAITVARLVGRMSVGPGWVSHLLQRTAVHLLRDAALTERLAGVGAEYARRRVLLLDALAAHGVVGHGVSGLNVWVEVADEAAVTLELAARGFAVTPGAPFVLTPRPAVRLTPSALDDAAIAGLAEALAGALRARRGRGG